MNTFPNGKDIFFRVNLVSWLKLTLRETNDLNIRTNPIYASTLKSLQRAYAHLLLCAFLTHKRVRAHIPGITSWELIVYVCELQKQYYTLYKRILL